MDVERNVEKVALEAVDELGSESDEMLRTSAKIIANCEQCGAVDCQLVECKLVKTISVDSDNNGHATIKTTIKRTWKLMSFKELPDFLKDNDFLLNHHRPQLNSVAGCLHSVFKVHTETGNIWTHLIGFLIFIYLIFDCYLIHNNLIATNIDKLIFAVYFAAALCCLAFSTIFHVFACHSHGVSKMCQKFDYVGIAIMITGSMISYLYYAFYCDFMPKIIYLPLFSAFGLIVAFVTLWPKMGTPKYRPLRASIFVVFGLSAVAPYVHMLVKGDVAVNHYKLVGMAFMYIFGAVLYANRFPERLLPGRCDLMFQSHQLFHVCVVIAAIVHYSNIHEIATIRQHGGDVCPSSIGDTVSVDAI